MSAETEESSGYEEFDGVVDHLFAQLDEQHPCDGTLTLTRAWLEEHHPEKAESFLRFVGRRLGGVCDCRVLRGILAIPNPGVGSCRQAWAARRQSPLD